MCGRWGQPIEPKVAADIREVPRGALPLNVPDCASVDYRLVVPARPRHITRRSYSPNLVNLISIPPSHASHVARVARLQIACSVMGHTHYTKLYSCPIRIVRSRRRRQSVVQLVGALSPVQNLSCRSILLHSGCGVVHLVRYLAQVTSRAPRGGRRGGAAAIYPTKPG